MMRFPSLRNLPALDGEAYTQHKQELVFKRSPHILQLDQDRFVYTYCDLHVIPEDAACCEMSYKIEAVETIIRRKKIVRRQRNKALSACDFDAVLVNTWDPRYTHHPVDFEEAYEREERLLRRNASGSKKRSHKAKAAKRKRKKQQSSPNFLATLAADFNGLVSTLFDDESNDTTEASNELGLPKTTFWDNFASPNNALAKHGLSTTSSF